jgi:hypothetical protein
MRLGVLALAMSMLVLCAHRCGSLLGEHVVISSGTPEALGR